MLCDKGAKTTQWGRIVFLTNGVGKTGNPRAKERSWTLILQESCRMVVSWASVARQCACGQQHCTVYLEVVLRVNLMCCGFLPPKKKKKVDCFLYSYIYPPYGPSSALLGIYPREMKMYALKKTCTQMFIAALFTLANHWK